MRTLNDHEALRIAEDVENRGAELYARAAAITRSGDMRDLFTRLCAEERDHAALFRAIADEATEDGAEYSGESALFLSAFAADIAFSGGLMRLARDGGLSSPVAVFDEAIASEKNSILFYEGIIEATGSDSVRQSLTEIVHAERGHLCELIQRRAALDEQGD